jgi:putative ubiquitin-RnfH superfamily antitoxin RatB of RatAB toxin-antitoxin module
MTAGIGSALTITTGDQTVTENSLLSFTVATDDINAIITVDQATLPTGANFASNTFSWAPATGTAAESPYSVIFHAEANGETISKTININVIALDKTALNAAITTANTKVSTAVAGTEIGQYPQSAITTFQTAINTAQTVADSTTATQTQINQAITNLQAAQTIFDVSRITAIDKTTLHAAITMANAKVAAAVAGTGIGQYPQTAIDAFRAAIATAQTVAYSTTATQTQVNQALITLQAAEITFDSAIETGADSVTNLKESGTGTSWVNWTWTNPTTDFSHVMIYIDGTFITTTTGQSYNATGFAEGTVHRIGIQTVDNNGNVNPAVVSDQAVTSTTADEINIDLVGLFGGYVKDMAVSGNYAYIGEGRTLAVVDITNVSNPSEVGRVLTPSSIKDIAVAGNYAYIADSDKGLLIVDISTPTSPKIVGNYDTDDAEDVVLSGNYAYIINSIYSDSSYSSSLLIIDITNPSSPKLAGSYDASGSIGDIAVAGNYVYLTNGNNLDIIDVRTPSSSRLVGIYTNADGSVEKVTVAGNYAYLITFDSNNYNAGFSIVDISNPSSPTLKSSYYQEYLSASDIAVVGNYAYVVYNGGGDIFIYDVNNPSSPEIVGSSGAGAESNNHIVVAGKYAYVIGDDDDEAYTGFSIVDISNPSSPTIAGNYYNRYGSAHTVAVSGNYAYLLNDNVASNHYLSIVDIKDLSSPKLMSSTYSTVAWDIVIVGNYAYIGDDDGLEIVDVSNPSSPTLIGTYDTDLDITGVAVSGNYAYVTNNFYFNDVNRGYLDIVDITNPSSPRRVGSYTNAGGSGGDIAIEGNYAYIAVNNYNSGSGYLEIVDIRNPASPKLVGIYPAGGSVKDVAIANNYAYIAVNNYIGSYNNLEIVDVNNPSSPTLVGSYITDYSQDTLQDIAVDGNYVYVTGQYSGLRIINISDPSSPKIMGIYDIGSFSTDVEVSGNYVYLAAGDLYIIRADLPSSSVDNPPVANAGTDKNTTTGSAVTFDASTSTDDIGITSYSWDFDESNGITSEASGITTTKTYTTAGTYTVTLTVTDTSGQISSDTLQVVVKPAATPTTLSYTPLYDNRLRDLSATSVLSTTTYLDVGKTSATCRDVMLFDLSKYKTTDTISKATLSLFWYYPTGATRASDTVVEIYRPVEWDPKYVTWNSRMSGVAWTNRGGNWFDKNGVSQGATPYASLTFAGSKVPDNKYYDFDVTQLVQEYVSGKYKNTGFFIKAKTESGNYIAFYSSEYSNVAMKPKLTITSTSGSTSTDTVPVANAGADKTAVAGSVVTFDASLSTDDKGIASYSWDFDSSNGITSESNTVSAIKTYTAAGTYTVTLTVTDTIGQKSTDTVQVIVSAATTPASTVTYAPTYDNRIRESSPTTVLSTTTYVDIGKTTSSYRDVMMFDLSSYKTTDTISKATLSLYWYYPAGATRTSDTVVEIYRPVEWDPKYVSWNYRMSGPPWATAGGNWFDKNAIAQGTTPYASMTFAGSSMPDNKYYEFDVTQLVQEYVSGKYKNTGFFLKAKTEGGNYIAFYSSEYSNSAMRPKLTVTSVSGSTVVDNPPVANSGADKIATTNSMVTFDAGLSTDDKGIASYSWDFDVSNGITSEASGVTATHAYTGTGTYTVTLTVTDTAGQKATDTMKVVVSSSVDNPPIANAGDDKTAIVGSSVTFDASASTDDKGITSYSWDFDQSNGITTDATTKTASKTYTAIGTYIVTLTVTDTSGQKSTDTLRVTVSNPVSAVSYAPLYDNRLRSDTPTTVLSTTTYLDIGRSSSTAREIMMFDLSSYKTTDTLSKATLSLYWYYPAGKTRTSDTVVEVYRPVEWDPKYVTWNYRISGTSWSNAGGSWYDKNAVAQGTSPYASITFPAGTVPGNKYYDFDVTQLVQEYVSGKYKNTGFFLKAKTESGNYIAFYSSEYSNAAMRPKLTITR